MRRLANCMRKGVRVGLYMRVDGLRGLPARDGRLNRRATNDICFRKYMNECVCMWVVWEPS